MLNHLPLPLFLLGLTSLYIGERTLGGAAHTGAQGVAGLALCAALIVGVLRWRRSLAERRRAHRDVLLAYLTSIAGLALYAVQQLGLEALSTGKAHGLLQVSWPACVFFGLLPAISMELAIGSMARTPTLEIWRVRLAARAARILCLAIITFAGINFTAAKWNHKVDLSYFKTTRVGTSTQAIVQNLTQPVIFTLFFPPSNEVLEQTLGYVEELARRSQNVQVNVTDQALEPERARDLKVRSNGYMTIQCGANTETLHLDLDAEEARATLRNLDVEVQQRLLKVVRPARVAYLTTGHMERDYAPQTDDKRPGLSDFKTLLESQGFTVRRLGLSEGLGRKVPDDAAVVIVIGPTESFTPMEEEALARYLNQGGRVLFGLDPDTSDLHNRLLTPLGLRLSKGFVANERYIVRLEGRSESPYDLVTVRASIHPSVSTLEQNNGRMGLILLGAGHLTKIDPNVGELNTLFTVHAMPLSWEDKNNNGKFDSGSEERGNYEFVAAVEKNLADNLGETTTETGTHADGHIAPEAQKSSPTKAPAAKRLRAIVVADADFAANGVVRNPGNAYLVYDAIRWLAGDEQDAGIIESEKDVPLVHRKDDDAVWFYGASFLLPATFLLGGVIFTRRASRPRRGS